MENDSIVDEEPIGLYDDEVPVSITYQGTFKDLNNYVQSASNELKLTKNFQYWHGSPYFDRLDVTYDGIVMVNKHNFVFDGQGHTICASSQKGFFIIRSSCSNITIKNCIFIDAGGKFALDCECPVNIINCTFQNCKGENFIQTINLRAGGTVTDCKFTDCYNAIIARKSASANIYGCSFTNCDGSINGGAIYLTGNGIIENCTFNENKAGYGGAVCFDGSGTIIRNCAFNGNSASASGGAVYTKTGKGSIENCRFNNNKAREGGALLFSNSGMTIKNCNFTGNTATKNGGAVNFTQGANIENCNFNENNAVKGGALFFETATANLKNCNFTGNTATDGSAIYVTKSCTLNGLNFNNNVAKGQGTVYINSYNRYYEASSIRNCIFSNNAANAGGAICFNQLGDSNLENCIFSKNRAATKGGAVYFPKSEGQKNINNCKFYDCTADDGGAVWTNRATVRNSKFTGNSANNGGAIYFNSGGTVEGSDFISNSASDCGGAVKTVSANVRNSNFVNNSASNYGGAIYTASGTVTNSNFDNNSASAAGAIFFNKQGTVQGSCFTSNTAQAAGAILINGSGIVENSVFTSNSATLVYCGAIMFMSEATVNNCSFVKNNAYYAFGGVGTVDKLTINDSIFEMNGALSFKHFGVLEDSGSIVTNNVLIYDLINPKLSFEVKDILSDQEAFIEIRLDKTINGNVKVLLDNTEYPVSINHGYGNKTVSNLPAGTHDVTAIFESDGTFNRSVVSATFNVKDINSLADPNLTISIADIFVGEDIFIEISANNTLSAVVRVEIENENYTVNVTDGYGNLTVSNLRHYGDYTAKTIFKHDDIFRNSEITTTFNISRFNPNLTVNAADAYIGQNVTLHIVIDGNVTGEVTIEFNGANQTINISDGMGNFTFHAPAVGNYSYNIFFDGDDFFFDDAKSVSFSVKPKEDPNLIVYAHNGCNNQPAIICVEIDENAVGEVILEIIPGIFEFGIEINNGKGNYTFYPDGDVFHEYNITFIGDYRFYNVTKSVSFNITEKDYAALTVSYPEEIYAGQNQTVCVEINSNVEGSVIISINGMDYPIEIINGNGNYTVSNLDIGDFTYTVAFSGDSRFSPDFEFVSFKVLPKQEAGLAVSSSGDCYEGQNVTVYVVIDENISGKVTVSVDGVDEVIEVAEGKGNYTFSGLSAGNYTCDIVFSGDYRFIGNNKSVSFKVLPKENADLEVSFSGDCYEAQNVTVYVVIDGDIIGNVTVGGGDNVIEIVDGRGNCTFSGLSAGNYTYDVVFSGDYRFIGDNKTVSFKILAKESPDLIIGVRDVYLGQDVVVNVLINENITGNVTIGVDGEDKLIEIVDGNGSYTFSALSVGNYTYDVVFSGDYRFTGDNKPVSFKVLAKEELDLKVNAGDVYVGQNAVINVLIDDDVNENVIIADNGSEKVIEIANGKGNYTLTGLTVGNYNYMVFFLGNEKYYTDFKAVSFKVLAKEEAGLAVSSSGDCYIGQNVTIFVVIDENITGNVTVGVDGEDNLIEIVDGRGSYTFCGLSAGNYTYDVVFSGDYRFAGDNRAVSFKVMDLVDPNLSVQVSDIYQGADAVVKIATDNAFTGRVNVKIASNSYAVDVVNGQATLSVSGLGVGNYVLTAYIDKTGMFKSDFKSVDFIVKANVIKLTLKKVKVKKSAKKLIIKATLKINGKAVKGKIIKFKFNKKSYKAKTDKKGMAKITVKRNVLKKLKVGKKVKYQVTYDRITKKISVKVKK